MKKLILFSGLILVGGAGFPQELGRVLSSTPITQQVGVPAPRRAAPPPPDAPATTTRAW